MIVIGPEGKRRKAVPGTQSVVFRSLIVGVVGLAVLGLGVQRLLALGAFTLGGLAMPLVGLFLLGLAFFVARDFPAESAIRALCRLKITVRRKGEVYRANAAEPWELFPGVKLRGFRITEVAAKEAASKRKGRQR